MRLPAITIRQPWATLIAMGVCDVASLRLDARHRGVVLIASGIDVDDEGHDVARRMGYPVPSSLPRGSIVGVASLADVTDAAMVRAAGMEPSPWAVPGFLWWRFVHAAVVPPMGVKGRPGLFMVDVDHTPTRDAITAWAQARTA